jgi:N-dimethylarginine dimethylaminohydrolase
MTYSVYQHWDPLKVCVVGRSYPPEFYSFIKNLRVRNVMERISKETEEDYQKLINLLKSFNVKVLRPEVSDDYQMYLKNGKIEPPPMTPRDYSIMLGNDFYFKPINLWTKLSTTWERWKGPDWPPAPNNENDIQNLPALVKTELEEWFLGSPLTTEIENSKIDVFTWKSVLDHIKENGNPIVASTLPVLTNLNAAGTTRIGKDIYIGTSYYKEDKTDALNKLSELYPGYRWHSVDTGGHSDATFCPVVPGLIISLRDIPTYADTFPGWEVVYLPGQSWAKVKPFLDLKERNNGKWWVSGEEFNDDFTDFVESWLGHWVGYVEETVFDVNMLVINEKNVVCNNYNKSVFDAFKRHGITPHIINFRHRYFWDGGLHCITSDVHREGVMQDFFPDRK